VDDEENFVELHRQSKRKCFHLSIFFSFKFKDIRIAIVDHRPITIPNEKNKTYFIINGVI